ncbi:uncharacterized protein PgNI_09963 [Pyricularia grisea]|uniref:Uncharacterized protein n=1 Tax=Pyricularia grisea TaxID=148305 RepID=A0A6P8ARE0_PYRGI|nr:uncharacterized protein PgNI_09963 [Pyricularia grisea]TLD04667.1 hypothetical protein PgNI_09963 [Pyricularia grisea]
MVAWNFFDGEKARGASNTNATPAYLPPRPWTPVKVVRSSVTTQVNDKKVRVRLKVDKRWEGRGA